MDTYTRDYLVSDRNGIIENRHEVHASVVDATGKTLVYLGNPERLTLIRSAAKPMQALVVVESGAMEKYGLDMADLALTCASHNSESRHVERAQAILKKADIGEDKLRCGGHPAIMPDIDRQWTRDSFLPTPIYSNCSGKHSGVLAAVKAVGEDVADYHLLGHPIQARIRKIVEEIAGLKEEDVQWGVDGCNMAAPAYALQKLAVSYSLFAQAADEVSKSGTSASPRTQSMARVFNAMATVPEMVAGNGRFCTALMQAHAGAVFGKVGADGVYGIGVRESEQTRRLGATGALGISVKIEDGRMDLVYAATAEILRQLEIGTPETARALDKFHHVEIVNTAGLVTGTVQFPFELRACN